MAASVQFKGVQLNADGRINLIYADSISLEFPDKASAIAWATSLDDPTPETIDWLRRALMAWWLKRDPTAATPSLVNGKTITVDLLATPVLKVV